MHNKHTLLLITTTHQLFPVLSEKPTLGWYRFSRQSSSTLSCTLPGALKKNQHWVSIALLGNPLLHYHVGYPDNSPILARLGT